MSKKSTFGLLAVFFLVLTCTTTSQAAAQRTFVAGPGIGSDANVASDCSFSMPCRNFSAAYGVTNTGGEIIALSPGVGYGGLSITKAITVTGLPGQVAFVAITAGAVGFSVAPGGTNLVVIRNISFNGQNAGTNTGLSHTSGRLVIDGCNFSQLNVGLSVNGGRTDVIDSRFHGNNIGLDVTGAGSANNFPPSASITTLVRIAGGHVTFNGIGFRSNGRGYDGNSVDRHNIWAFSTGSSTATVNVAGNTTWYQCTDGLSPNMNPCSAHMPTYQYNTDLK